MFNYCSLGCGLSVKAKKTLYNSAAMWIIQCEVHSVFLSHKAASFLAVLKTLAYLLTVLQVSLSVSDFVVIWQLTFRGVGWIVAAVVQKHENLVFLRPKT